MKEKESALFSRYIIDGLQCDTTPEELLRECMYDDEEVQEEGKHYDDIIDESIDPPVTSFTYSNKSNGEYLEKIAQYNGKRPFRMLYPEAFTAMTVASALLERLWNKGHYKLENLSLWAEWEWNTRPLGNMSAFYNSARTASEYIFDLGCRLEGYTFAESDSESYLKLAAWLSEQDGSVFQDSPYESRHPWIEEERICPQTFAPDEDSQVLYIPFDTAPFRLGGSLLAEIHGHNGGPGPHIQDPDYFIDCFEVVRELAEDGILLSGTTICDGGLAKALCNMCIGCGMEVNLGGISSSYMDNDTTRILFSEIPGVLIQVSESNMDYLDSQLLLQDVAYYPLGSPTSEFCGIRLGNTIKATVAGILASLINQASEGED